MRQPTISLSGLWSLRVLDPGQPHLEETQEQVLKADQERVSLRRIERIFKVGRQTAAKWVREYLKHLPVVLDTLLLYEVGDGLKIDELWSLVVNKDQKGWSGLFSAVVPVRLWRSTSVNGMRLPRIN